MLVPHFKIVPLTFPFQLLTWGWLLTCQHSSFFPLVGIHSITATIITSHNPLPLRSTLTNNHDLHHRHPPLTLSCMQGPRALAPGLGTNTEGLRSVVEVDNVNFTNMTNITQINNEFKYDPLKTFLGIFSGIGQVATKRR